MLEGSFRRSLKIEADAIPLPPKEDWIGRSSVGGRDLLVVAGAVAVLALGAAALVGSRLSEIVPAQAPLRASAPARPTSTAGHAIAPLPNEYRNVQFGYNLVVPAWFHVTQAFAAPPSDPPLLSRVVFTARGEQDEGRLASARSGGQFAPPPWDLVVEVYEKGGHPLVYWATAAGCNRSAPTGASYCATTSTRIRGADALIGTKSSPHSGKIYVVDRGDKVLILRYVIGSESDRPADVTQETLVQIVASLGLT